VVALFGGVVNGLAQAFGVVAVAVFGRDVEVTQQHQARVRVPSPSAHGRAGRAASFILYSNFSVPGSCPLTK
jgi:hypothetical protein